jgi:GTPase SAR1 family protein
MNFPPEIESGNIEYKLKITTECNHRIEQLATQMKWRLNEGNGVAEYLIGVGDDGTIEGISLDDYNKTIKNFSKIIHIIDAKILSLDKNLVDNELFYYRIKITSDTKVITSVRIIFIGPTNSGKSTIIGNLIKNSCDNGNGKSRNFVFNHKHEIYSGETSSISIKTIKTYNNNQIFNINLIDTPGNLKYQKTTLTCICKYTPNLIILTINPLEIDIKLLTYYLNLLKYFKYPFYIIFTKNDKYNSIHKNDLLKKILDISKKKLSYIEINNITRLGYNHLNNIINKFCYKPSLIYGKTNVCKSDKIYIQICDILNIPNMSKIYTGLTFNNLDISKEYILSSPSLVINKIKFNSIYFLDKPKQKIETGHLVTFTIENKIELDNKSDLVISLHPINKISEIYVKCDDKISNTQGICIYNNQYNPIKIKYEKKNIYKLTNIDNSDFINLSNNIIIKVHDSFYYTQYITI